MGRVALGVVKDQISRIFGSGTLSGASESELLRRFASRSDEAASEVIVARHGPMVLGVCRRILRDPSDVDDAYQATFLVLARRAASIRDGEALGPWLFGVAHRVALRARSRRARLRSREVGDVEERAAILDRDRDLLDLPEVLDREIGSLPGPLRSAFVLCHLEGRTYQEAADSLGWTEGMVRGRLSRARDRLRDRLSRRGFASAVPLFARLTEMAKVTPPRLPAGLATTSATTLELANGVLWMIRISRLLTIFAPTLALAAIGAAVLARPAAPTSQEAAKPSPTAKDVPKTKRAIAHPDRSWFTIDPPDLVIIEALEALPGRPIMGDHLVRPDGTVGLGFYGDVAIAGLTRKEAKAKIVLHLRKFLTDESLGLIKQDLDAGKPIEVAPEDTDRVFVDISAYNSKVHYVDGEFGMPGRIPFTGNVRVLDVIHYAGGLLSTADPATLRLLREEAGKVKTMAVNYQQIMAGDDLSTNFDIIPGDRLVVDRRRDLKESTAGAPDLRAINRRIDELDKKLDQILSTLQQPKKAD